MVASNSDKEDVVTLNGVVLERLPNANFRVKLENDRTIICHSSGKIKRNKISIVIGDAVVVELSVYDLSKGRIILRSSAGRPDKNQTQTHNQGHSQSHGQSQGQSQGQTPPAQAGAAAGSSLAKEE